MLKTIGLFDTSIVTDNVGDEIIMDSIMREMRDMFPEDFYVRIPTHDKIGSEGRRYARLVDHSFVGGTNLMCAYWWLKSQWKVGLLDFWRIGSPILMGVGWRFYQRDNDPITAFMMRVMLSKKYKHSVRDEYTKQRVVDMGVENVLNTGCPTMWRLTPEHCATISQKKSQNALITVTAYRGDEAEDKAWINLVCDQYKTVYFWPQMHDDYDYIRKIAGDRVTMLPASLKGYDDCIDNNNIDYIGTRLHGGIRVLQRAHRALIIEVDNRAKEISKDTGLPTVERKDLDRIKNWIEKGEEISIKMPWDVIKQWKGQFSK